MFGFFFLFFSIPFIDVTISYSAAIFFPQNILYFRVWYSFRYNDKSFVSFGFHQVNKSYFPPVSIMIHWMRFLSHKFRIKNKNKIRKHVFHNVMKFVIFLCRFESKEKLHSKSFAYFTSNITVGFFHIFSRCAAIDSIKS